MYWLLIILSLYTKFNEQIIKFGLINIKFWLTPIKFYIVLIHSLYILQFYWIKLLILLTFSYIHVFFICPNHWYHFWLNLCYLRWHSHQLLSHMNNLSKRLELDHFLHLIVFFSTYFLWFIILNLFFSYVNNI